MPRAPKHCGRPGCDETVQGRTYCALHEAEHQAEQTARRGTARRRGYDTQHDKEARIMKARAIREGWTCPRCGQPIIAGQRLDYGHTTARSVDPAARADRVEHAHCNRQAGNR